MNNKPTKLDSFIPIDHYNEYGKIDGYVLGVLMDDNTIVEPIGAPVHQTKITTLQDIKNICFDKYGPVYRNKTKYI